MNSLPSNMKRHTLFRDNSNSHTFVFQDSFPLPTPDKIKMQVRYHGKILEIDPEIAVDRQRVTYTYTPEMLADIPEISDHYLVLDGKSFLGGQLVVLIGYGEQEISETQVMVTDGEATVIEIPSLDVVSGQVAIATEKAEQATLGATTATTQAGIATAGANVATTKAGEAAENATIALDAKEETLQARDQVIGPLATKMDLYKADTFSAMQQFIVDEQPEACMFLVLADETYSGLPRFHGYTKLPANPIVQLVSY